MVVEWLIVVVVIVTLAGVLFTVLNKYVHGNKQIIDTKQNFNVAYIELDRTKPPLKVNVRKWNDYDKSDSVQVVTDDGKTYYTHFSKVVLCIE